MLGSNRFKRGNCGPGYLYGSPPPPPHPIPPHPTPGLPGSPFLLSSERGCPIRRRFSVSRNLNLYCIYLLCVSSREAKPPGCSGEAVFPIQTETDPLPLRSQGRATLLPALGHYIKIQLLKNRLTRVHAYLYTVCV